LRSRGTAPVDALNTLLDELEEALSRAVGDIAAHRLIGTARALGAQQADAASRLVAGLAEYALEERRLLVARTELEAFAQAAAQLQEDLELLRARIDRLAAGR
jgi:ubiquinone biosynthesis protein UbiJ